MIAADLYRFGTEYRDLQLLEPALRNWKEMPPEGGWAVTVLVNGRKEFIDSDPLSIAERIFNLYKNAGQPTGLDVIFNFLNHTWLLRDPKRALFGSKPPNPLLTPKRKHWDFTALSIDWLQSFAEKFELEKWTSAVQHISALTDPSNQYITADTDFFEKLTKARIASTPKDEEEVKAWLRQIS